MKQRNMSDLLIVANEALARIRSLTDSISALESEANVEMAVITARYQARLESLRHKQRKSART